MLSFCLDDPSEGSVSGWAFDPDKSGPVPIEVRCGESIIAFGATGLVRPDVAKDHPTCPFALTSGFLLTYPRYALNRFASENSVSVWSGETKLGEHPLPPAASTLLFRLDNLSVGFVSGWAFDFDKSDPLPIEVRCGESVIVSGATGLARPDVGMEYSACAAAPTSGFLLTYPRYALNRFGPSKISISVWSGETKLGEHSVLPAPALLQLIEGESAETRRAYVPSFVLRAANRLSGSPDPSIEQITDTMVLLAESRSSDPRFVKYARFISSAWNHCRFVDRYFPPENTAASASDKDFLCKQNSAGELISIIHHLYVLKSYGVSGAFAEFGSFKGYSSSILSWACASLGLEMHIFDSFEGLPPSTSTFYRSGEFAGSLEEVRHNIGLFGVADNVVFHKGYFSESLRNCTLPPLITLWMDVDLESSSRDVMTIADKIDPAGAVFSHEIAASDFDGLSVITRKGADSVAGPIVARFADFDAKLDGRFLEGDTGAFWRRSGGIPVLPSAALRRILEAI